MLGQRVKAFVDKVFDGRALDLALRLIEAEHFTPEERKRLQAKLSAKKSS